jgi:hypothetical protein
MSANGNNRVAEMFPADDEPRAEADEADGGHFLTEAVNNPGVVEIPESKPDPKAAVPPVEIPERILGDVAGAGTRLTADPAVLSVKLDRPGPHTFVRLFTQCMWRGVLLAHQPVKDRSPDYYYILDEMQQDPRVQDSLRQVRVLLCADMGVAAEAFLWLVPESQFSPYWKAVELVLSQGDDYIDRHKFRFGKADLKSKSPCPVWVEPLGPTDPQPVMPSRPVSKLLPEALTQERMILSATHPVYAAITTGQMLRK